MTLTDFLLDHPVAGLKETVVVSSRLADYPFTITIASAAEMEEYSRRCRRGRDNFDGEKFNLLLAINHCLDPDFRSVELLQQAGCVTPEELVNHYLKAGEIAALAKAVYRLSGFGESNEELVATVKN